LRSLALFRIGLGLLVIADLIDRSWNLQTHYTDTGALPRSELIETILHPAQWSLHSLNGQFWVQLLLFGLTTLSAFALLIGYRSRLAIILSWVLLVSLHNRNPLILDGGDSALRLPLFWSLFLPLAAYYAIESALNTTKEKLPDWIFSGATVALTLQICFFHWFTAISALSGARSLNIAGIWIDVIAPILLFIPVNTTFFRLSAVLFMVLLHVGLGLVGTGLFAWVIAVAWLVFIPTAAWSHLADRTNTPERQHLRIYYDVECGFCKKVVYLIRTFLVLPNAVILPAQEDASILADMKAYNSWVVVDYTDRRHIKFEAIAYVCRISPIFNFLTPVLESEPVMVQGNRFYETIASNRKMASKFTRWMQFQPITIQSFRWHHPLNWITLFLITYIISWNLVRLPANPFQIPEVIHQLGIFLRLDQ